MDDEGRGFDESLTGDFLIEIIRPLRDERREDPLDGPRLFFGKLAIRESDERGSRKRTFMKLAWRLLAKGRIAIAILSLPRAPQGSHRPHRACDFQDLCR